MACLPTDDDVIHTLIVDILQAPDAVVVLVQEISAVIRTYYYIALRGLGQTCNVITAKEVGMLCIATEHQYLMSVVTTNATALGAIPEKTL
jgi:hypothetical protein